MLLACCLLTAAFVSVSVRSPRAGAAAGPGWSIGSAYTGDFPDPAILQVGSTYYGYSTSSAGGHIPVTRSTDSGKTWIAVGDALPTVAGWADSRDIWAPGVAFIGGQYQLYYAAPFRGAGGTHCISRATSSSPSGPFVDSSSSPMVCQLPSGGSIDP
ncbi:MAG: beta-xylosidase, partial [Actinomycetia bacterium]|nr:beta-xylosidase [Actinomycetes bacterium]